MTPQLERLWTYIQRCREGKAATQEHAIAACDLSDIREKLAAAALELSAVANHVHAWQYNLVVNAMICRCGERIDCDARLPDAIRKGYDLADRKADL